jgi:hypothetical protein
MVKKINWVGTRRLGKRRFLDMKGE